MISFRAQLSFAHKNFSDKFNAIERKKTRVKMTEPLYLGKSILDIRYQQTRGILT